MSEEDIVLVTQLPSDSWFEGFALRPNGKILAARLDQPELYTFRAEDEDATPELLHTFPSCTGLVNIDTVPGRQDEYVVLAANLDLETASNTDNVLWHVALSADDSSPPKATKMCDVTGTGFAIGIVAISERTFLIPDSHKSCIWQLDSETGTKTEFYADETMKVATADHSTFGLNRIRVFDDFLYFTNTSAGFVGRIPIAMDRSNPAVGIRVTGPVQKVCDQLPHLDGLAISKDQTHAYTASYVDGQLLELRVNPATGEGKMEVIVTSLDSPTGVELVYVDGKPKLYVVCCGEIDMAWIPKYDENPWAAMGDINSAISITHEVAE
ncbi:hypothetical protein F5Y15DRAFT_417107 [Xylariaceae sp. FL0016]|nr:hypothetical protein F5Y15DRAFT_417107 [Xylariaceae sp. FL0016]